jgi:hypothetical protein
MCIVRIKFNQSNFSLLFFQRNTFQAVLATNGVKSFAVFNYNNITWTTGSNSGGETNTGLSGEAPAVVSLL